MRGIAWRRKRPERLLRPLALAGLRAAWLAPLGRALGFRYPAGLVLALLLAGEAVAAALAGRRRALRLVALATPVAAALVAAEYRAALPGLAVWTLGLATGRWGVRSVRFEAALGATALAALLVLADGAAGQASVGALPVCALLAMAADPVARIQALRGRPRGSGAGGQWLAAVLAVALLATAAGWGAARFATPERASRTLAMVQRARWAMGEVAIAAVDDPPEIRLPSLPAWVAPRGGALESVLARLEGVADDLFRRLLPATPPAEGRPGYAGGARGRGAGAGAPPAEPSATPFGAALAAAAGGAAWGAAHILRRRRRRGPAARARYERRVAWFLRARRGRVHGAAPLAPAAAGHAPAVADDPDTRRAVRALYRTFLARLRAAGLARAPWQTPAAYAARLSRVLPGEGDALRAITRAYLVARYAPRPPLQWDVRAAQAALARIEGALNALATCAGPDGDA